MFGAILEIVTRARHIFHILPMQSVETLRDCFHALPLPFWHGELDYRSYWHVNGLRWQSQTIFRRPMTERIILLSRSVSYYLCHSHRNQYIPQIILVIVHTSIMSCAAQVRQLPTSGRRSTVPRILYAVRSSRRDCILEQRNSSHSSLSLWFLKEHQVRKYKKSQTRGKASCLFYYFNYFYHFKHMWSCVV